MAGAKETRQRIPQDTIFIGKKQDSFSAKNKSLLHTGLEYYS